MEEKAIVRTICKSVIPLLAAALLAGGCYRVPVTGRSALNLVDEKEVADPTKPQFMACIALCHFCAERFADASLWAENALREQPHLLTPLLVRAASAAHMGRIEDARQIVPEILKESASYRVSRVALGIPFRRPQDVALLSEGLRRAGIPE